MSNPGESVDPHLAFTVATVWREERISCPHPDLLQSWLQGGLQGGARDFVAFHLADSQCPYCNAVVDLRDRLLRSTATALRRSRA
jgi:hypothetical protein